MRISVVFPTPFGPNDGDALARLDVEVDVIQYIDVGGSVTEAQLLDGDRVPIELLYLLETDVGILARGRGRISSSFILSRGPAPERSPCRALGGVGREPAHELLQVRDPFLCLRVRSFDPRPRLGRGQHEIVVVARVDLQLLEVRSAT